MSTVNILEELTSYGIKPKKVENEHAKILCPFHGDDQPSMSVRITGTPLGYAKCFSCGASVDFVGLLHRLHVVTNQANKSHRVPSLRDLAAYLAHKYGLTKRDAALSIRSIDECCENFRGPNALKDALLKRYIREEEIEKFRLGFKDGRITIPISDEFGSFVNILHYLPGAIQNKFQSLKSGRGQNRLFPLNQFSYENLILTAGPIKAIAGTRLNEKGYGAVTVTAGEGSWDSSFNHYFQGKKVWVVYDKDTAGYQESQKRCADLFPFAEVVHAVDLPFAMEKGGLDDFLYCVGEPALLKVLENAKPWQPATVVSIGNEPPERKTLTQAFNADNVGKRLEVPIRVSGVCTTPYYAPKTFEVTCDKECKPAGTCSLCPVYSYKGAGPFTQTIHPESPSMLLVVDKAKARVSSAMQEVAGIPAICNRHSFKVLSYQNVEEIRVSPLMDLQQAEAERQDQPALCLEPVEANSAYEITGRLYPHPDTQKATFVISKAKAVSDDISKWSLDQDLAVFQPKGVSVKEQYEQILLYWEREVTRIYQRKHMHALVDLVFHTPLLYNFGGRLQNGWGQVLIVGDNGQGKSNVTSGFKRWLGLGVSVDCKNASVAGLLGGCTPMDSGSKKQFIKWGVLPSNDRKLVIMEELAGCPIESLNRLTNTRSEGVAHLPKIENKSTMCRTRLIGICNSRPGWPLSSYSFGVDAIYGIHEAGADIRRYDAALCLMTKNSKPFPDPNAELRFFATQEQFRAATLFAWTITPERIRFESEEYIIQKAREMLDVYVEDKIPLVNAGEAKYKIAKLSAALAIRLFSTDDGENVLVTNEHVDYIVGLLNEIYEDEQTGYRRYSDGVKALTRIDYPDQLEKEFKTQPYGPFLRDQLLATSYFAVNEIEDWGSLDRMAAKSLISLLVRCKAIIGKGRNGYVKTPGFADFLKNLTFTPGSSPPDGNSEFG